MVALASLMPCAISYAESASSDYFECLFESSPGEEPERAYVRIDWQSRQGNIRFDGDVFSGHVKRKADGIYIRIDSVLEFTSVIRFADEGKIFIATGPADAYSSHVAEFTAFRLYHHRKPPGEFTLNGTCRSAIPPHTD